MLADSIYHLRIIAMMNIIEYNSLIGQLEVHLYYYQLASLALVAC